MLVTFAVDQADAERVIQLTETGLPYLALLTPASRTGFDTSSQPLFQK
jgi:pilus assembly protein CpaB